MNFIKRHKITKRLVGTHTGRTAPDMTTSDYELVEVDEATQADASAKLMQAISEYRDITYDAGVVLGDAPANVVKIDLDGNSVLKSGESAELSLTLLGGGTVSISVGGRSFNLSGLNRKVSMTVSAT